MTDNTERAAEDARDQLHAAIVNLPHKCPDECMTPTERMGYAAGHRDARQAAAELARAALPVREGMSPRAAYLLKNPMELEAFVAAAEKNADDWLDLNRKTREGMSEPVDDLAALVRRLAHALRKAAPDNDLADLAVDYLRRQGLQGSALRTAGAAGPVGDAEVMAAPAPNPCKLAECCPRCLRDGWVERESECKKHGNAGVMSRVTSDREPS